jgi:hypothetical protein
MSEQEKIYLGNLMPLGGQLNPVSCAYLCGEPEQNKPSNLESERA